MGMGAIQKEDKRQQATAGATERRFPRCLKIKPPHQPESLFRFILRGNESCTLRRCQHSGAHTALFIIGKIENYSCPSTDNNEIMFMCNEFLLSLEKGDFAIFYRINKPRGY